MPKQAIELMFGAYRRRLLATLLLRPDERFHVRELERMTGMSAGSIHRELKVLAEVDLLRRSEVGNQVLYEANQASPIFEELAAIFRKTIGLVNVLGEALSSIGEQIAFAFVFGSMADGSNSYTSDIDVLVLSEIELIDLVKALMPVSSSLGREINPVLMSSDRFLSQLKQKDRFVLRVLNEPKLFVIGDEHEFDKLVENRSTG